MKNTFLGILCLLVSISAATQTQQVAPNTQKERNKLSVTYAETITVKDLKKHLYILASDEYGGRGTGQKGQDMAAEYITNFYAEWGCPTIGDDSTYYQQVDLLEEGWNQTTFKVNDKDYTFMEDYFAFGKGTKGLQNLQDEAVVFIVYGIDDKKHNDYKNVDVKDKVVMILPGEPIKKGKFRLTGTDEPSEWTTNWRKKLVKAAKNGAKAVLVISPDITEQVDQFGYYLKSNSIELDMGKEAKKSKKPVKASKEMAPSAYISADIAQNILGTSSSKTSLKRLQKKLDKGKAQSFVAKVNINIDLARTKKSFQSKNLLAYFEGSDPKLKDELIIITAHYDHLGIEGKEIYNGADDDGSGTVSILEIAEAFAKAKADGHGPRRSVLVMHVTAEEKGLLGSQYYTDLRPLFPLENTVANLNVDMVGRIDNDHENGDYVYIIGSDKLSSELHNINETANKSYTKMDLDYKYNAEDDPNRFYYRSDHYNFAKNNIPVIFYFNGTHDDYHQVSDTPDKINYEALAKRAQLVFHTAWELANRDARIKVDSNKK